MSSEPIAIVGAAARLPGAEDLDAYWDLLIEGRDAVTEIPDGRWSKSHFFHPQAHRAGKSYTWAAGVLPQIDRFDPAYFGISPREAVQIDPQQRLLLELTAEALEDAGIPASGLAGTATGVYMGASGTEFGNSRLGDPAGADAYFMLGTTTSIVANRLSYIYDLAGPSFIVDTACSSSLVALHLACQAIRDGQAEMALAGGVNMLLTPYPFVGFCQASMLSPDGRCFAFDARANGYVRSEGAGVVLLKPLSRAIADKDAIRAVLLGTGVNSDGRTMGMSLPNGEAQAKLLRQVYAEAGLTAQDVAFIEAHGTGTAAGDPIELGALGQVIARNRASPLLIGSAKSNVGHLEVASGMAGLFKAMLAIENRRLPPSIHYETPNPNIPFEELNIKVAARPADLGEGRIVAGVNSFGFGGTNAHAVLASAPKAERPAASDEALPPLLISARSQAALAKMAQEWAQRLDGAEHPADLIRGAARRREHGRHRMVVSGETSADLAEALRSAQAIASRVEGQAVEGKLAFVFTGNGSQWRGMGRDALAHSPAFRREVEEVDTILKPLLGWSVIDRLEQEEDGEVLARTDVAQPLLFAIQVGVVEALRAQGIAADGAMGHSVGEIAAAWAAGALTLEDACRIVVARSHHQQRTQGAGRMAALALSPEAAAEAIAHIGGLELAAHNSDSGVTVAGPRPALDQLRDEAAKNGWRFTPLDLDYAFHSAVLDPVREDLIADLAGLHGRACGDRFVSTVTGATHEGQTLDPEYWWANIRQPVHFREAVKHMAQRGFRVFVEIGPHQILQSYVRETLKGAEVEGRILPTLTRQATTRDPFPLLAARIHVAGGDLSRSVAYDGAAEVRDLPRHPWLREQYKVAPTPERTALADRIRDHALLGHRTDAETFVWRNTLDTEIAPWVGDHALEGVALLPAAAMVEIGLAAARARHPATAALAVADLDILRAMPFEPGEPREVRVVLKDDRFTLESRPRMGEEPFSLHAVGRIAAPEPMPAQPPTPFAAVRTIDADGVYGFAKSLGLQYGPLFQTVTKVEIDTDGVGLVHLDSARAEPAAGHILQPSLFDGALQGFLALLSQDEHRRAGESLLPARMGEVRVLAPFGRTPATARIAVTRRGGRSVSGDVFLYDADGGLMAQAKDCWFAKVELSRQASAPDRTFHFGLTPVPRDEGIDADLKGALATARSDPSDGQAETTLLFEAYLAAAAHDAIDRTVGPGSVFNITDLIEAGVLARQAAPMFAACLQLLAGLGLAEEDKAGWRLVSAEDLGAPEVLWRTLVEEQPSLVADLALSAAAHAALPAYFAGGTARPRPSALVDQFLYAGPAGRSAVSALVRAVAAVANSWPTSRPLRILEVGSSSGAVSRAIRQGLAGWKGVLRYEGGADLDGGEGTFDLVISAYGLTRGHADEHMLFSLSERLAPGGLLLAAEPQPGPLWDLLFGLDPDWWSQSASPEFPVPASRSAEEWTAVASRAGLGSAATVKVEAAPWSANIIGASKPVVAERAIPAPSRPVVVIAQAGDPLAEPLAEALSGALVQIHHPSKARKDQALTGLLAEAGEGVEVVVLPPRSAEPLSQRLAAILSVAAALGERTDADLWLVTRSAETSPEDAAVRGLGRTLINESPNLHVRLVDIEAALSPAIAAQGLAAEIAAPDRELEVVLSNEGRHALRLQRGLAAETEIGPRGLIARQPGLLDSLEWKAAATRALGAGEVRIEVKASGLNFRDVMWAQGLLPEEALLDGFAGATLGLECAGVILETGAAVRGLSVGDRVMAFSPAALAEEAVTAAHAVVRLPDEIGFAEAATAPVAYLTVLYALGRMARLSAGETVLIHGGAGGVGQAAIQYARCLGAVVIATAGSATKREFLRQLGADHVLDSRSLAFVDEVRAITAGRGVDVVLNSLSGEAMEESLRLVAPFGRFCELGKRDFYADTKVGLRPLRRNVSYFAIDADSLPLHQPELARELLAEAVSLMDEGALRPLPYRAFGFSEAVEAFRLMQGAGHIGKIVLTPDLPPVAAVAERIVAPKVRGDRTYLITGGLSGFGLATAEHLAAQGAKHLALTSRRGASAPEAAEVLAKLEALGVNARAYACDVADPAALEATLAQVRANGPPLAGVVHAAMVIDDGLLADMTSERLEKVIRPKVQGALNLDRATRDDPIEVFVLFSSATTVLGAPGQGAYVAANMALEALAAARKAEGLPGIAVGWGPIADVGFLARQETAKDALARRLAATPFTAQEALDALPALIESGIPAPAFAAVQWDAAKRRLPILASPVFEEVASGAASCEDIDLAERLAGLPAEEARDLVTIVIREEVAKILSSSADRIDPARPLPELGMDSLMAVELRLTLETRLGVSLPLLSLGETTTLTSLAGRIAKMATDGVRSDADVAKAILQHEQGEVETAKSAAVIAAE